jgi:hypothetical protein
MLTGTGGAVPSGAEDTPTLVSGAGAFSDVELVDVELADPVLVEGDIVAVPRPYPVGIDLMGPMSGIYGPDGPLGPGMSGGELPSDCSPMYLSSGPEYCNFTCDCSMGAKSTTLEPSGTDAWTVCEEASASCIEAFTAE